MWYVKIVEGTVKGSSGITETKWEKIGRWLSFKVITGVSPPQEATKQEVIDAWIKAWYQNSQQTKRPRMKVVRVYWKQSHTPTSEGGSVINTKLLAIGPKLAVRAG